MSPVSGLSKFVVQPSDQFGCFHIGWILITERSPLDSKYEPELVHVCRKLGKVKMRFLPFIEVQEFETLEIAEQNVPRPVALRDGIEVRQSLIPRSLEVPTCALLFNEQYAWPEQVDEAVSVVQPAHMLLVAGNAASLNAEDFEEIVVEALSFAFLVCLILPALGKRRGTCADLVPRKPHQDASALP